MNRKCHQNESEILVCCSQWRKYGLNQKVIRRSYGLVYLKFQFPHNEHENNVCVHLMFTCSLRDVSVVVLLNLSSLIELPYSFKVIFLLKILGILTHAR